MSSGDHHFDDVVQPGALARLRAILLRFPEVGAALRVPRVINRRHEVPYLAGSSNDGRTVYIDRGLPERIDGIPLDKYLEVHEATEWALWHAGRTVPKLREYSHYEPSHHLATAAEQYALLADGHDWAEYRRGLEPYYEPTEREALVDVPPDLAEYPYSGKDLAALQKAKSRSKFAPDEVHYLPWSATGRHCGDCSMFLPRLRACTIVHGKIAAAGGCDKFEPKE